MERGRTEVSAVDDVRDAFGLEVVSISTLDDLIGFLGGRPELARQLHSVDDYRKRYGATT
jgi:orotate phosphoribosyltransferase